MIRLTNTRTRSKDAFTPLDAKDVRMYVCGPTVYDRAHLGNARPVVVFDVLYRLLRHVYGEGAVTYVRNFTDVDDKINAEALRRQRAGAAGSLEDLIRGRTEETIAWYHADMGALGALPPTHEPRATDWVPQMVAMIEGLIASGHAYAAAGHVLFRVRSYPGYGRLSGRSVDDMIAGARVEVAPFKEDPMDFVLWKPSGADEPGWDSPWGRGRPGWHIECSAMAKGLLGDAFDIHGGGIDLQFPHHENEIAQSCCGHVTDDDPLGAKAFAQVWLHNEMLLVEGKKMSKSLGNFFTVRDLLDQGVPGEVIRFVFLMTHYRSPMDWTEEKRKVAQAAISRWDRLRRFGLSDPDQDLNTLDADVDVGVVSALCEDLNTHEALRLLNQLSVAAQLDRTQDQPATLTFLKTAAFMGFTAKDDRTAGITRSIIDAFAKVDPAVMIDALAAARDSKDWHTADRIKAALTAAGVRVMIGKGGITYDLTPDFDPAKLEGIL